MAEPAMAVTVVGMVVVVVEAVVRMPVAVAAAREWALERVLAIVVSALDLAPATVTRVTWVARGRHRSSPTPGKLRVTCTTANKRNEKILMR
jgi:hypothetical protein